MKKLFYLLFSFMIVSIGCANSKPQGETKRYNTNFDHVEDISDLEVLIKNPTFRGPSSESAIKQLEQRVKVNSLSSPCQVSGRVIILMVIGENGLPISPQVYQGIDPNCDEIARRSVSEVEFGPAFVDGKPVRVMYSVPVVFN